MNNEENFNKTFNKIKIKIKGEKDIKIKEKLNEICKEIKAELNIQLSIQKTTAEEKKSSIKLENILREVIANYFNQINSDNSLNKDLKNNIIDKIDKIIFKPIKFSIKEIINSKAENHLYYNLISKDTKNVFDFLFFILYYGGSRPERASAKHIYDTKNDIINKNVDYRFDILSLLVNTLNPLQTLSRFYGNIKILDLYKKEEVKNQFEKENKVNKLEKWLNLNKIKNLDIQNFILPIYSVDLLLAYLRKTYDINELGIIIPSTLTDKTEKYHEEMRKRISIYRYYDLLSELTKKALNKIGKGEKEDNNNNLWEIANLKH